MESATMRLNERLYGICITPEDDKNFFVEMINNPDFDMGDSLPGWEALSAATYIALSSSRPLDNDNLYSLMVSVGDYGIRGGAVANGYGGISVKNGERYRLSFFIRTTFTETPSRVSIALEEPGGGRALSASFEVMPSFLWTQYTHTFVATGDASNASLVFSPAEASVFFLDKVSLLPENTSNSYGMRPEIMAMIDSISPTFLLYKGSKDKLSVYSSLCQDLNMEFISASDPLIMERNYFADEKFFISGRYFPSSDSISETQRRFAVGLSATCGERTGDLGAAVAEACLLIRAENDPRLFSGIAFIPVTGVFGDSARKFSPLLYSTGRTSPVLPAHSWHLLKMFAKNRGDALLSSSVNTYLRPQVEEAQPGFESADDSFDLIGMALSKSDGIDSLFNYEISASLRQMKKNPSARIQITPSVFLSVEEGKSIVCRKSGFVCDTLSVADIPNLNEEHVLSFRLMNNCDTLQCYFRDTLLHRIIFPPLPAVLASASFDKKGNIILIKVVNTAIHDEIIQIDIRGASVSSRVSMIQFKDLPSIANSQEEAVHVSPVESYQDLGHALRCKLPPNSVTVLKLQIKG